MKPRFTISSFLWLTVAACLSLGWYLDSRALNQQLEAETTEMRKVYDSIREREQLIALYFAANYRLEKAASELGEMKLDEAAEEVSGDEDWHKHCIPPKKGHVYIQKIDAQGQKMLVQFRIDDIEQDTLHVSWRKLEN